MSENAFDKGVDYLKDAYNKLLRIEQLAELINRSKGEEKRLAKMISQEEKNKKDDVTSAIKKRKADINSAYDKEIDVVRGKIKQLEMKREACKTKEQDKRFEIETQELRQEANDCVVEIKNVLKQYHISRICRTNLYYRLFLPKGIKDYLVLLLWIIVTVFAIPMAICTIGNYTFLKEVSSKTIYYVLIFVLCISFVFITYLLIVNRTKVRYPKQLLHCRNQKDKIYAIHRQMRAVRNKIKKDKDESDYGLDTFDKQIAAFQKEMAAIGENKKQAIKDFVVNKQPVVEREVAAAHEETLQDYRNKLVESEENQTNAINEMKDLKLDISGNYEAYLGKEYVNIEQLEILIDIMEEEGILTIGEAIASLNNGREA